MGTGSGACTSCGAGKTTANQGAAMESLCGNYDIPIHLSLAMVFIWIHDF